VVAFHEALKQHEAEGGVDGRLKRYSDNRDRLVAGMRKIHKNFEFGRFYNELKQRQFIIYPGKLTLAESFRVGCIGQIDVPVIDELLAAIAETLDVMGVDDCTPAPL